MTAKFRTVLAVTILTSLTVTAPVHAQTAECSDGWTSNSASFQGTCSHHGGVAVWDDEGMKDEANQWCDENPSLCESSHWEGIEGDSDHPGDTGIDNDDEDNSAQDQ